jgi:thiamine pyrophosphate-dependent acetolactate synthase large subunit-like protein
MRGSDAIVAALSNARVRYVFGLVGDGTLSFVSKLDGRGCPRFVATLHENSALAGAIAFARMTNTVGIASTTQGPGLTNAFTAIRAAALSRTPLVVLTGAVPAGATDHIQYVDQEAVFAAAGARVEAIADVSDIGPALHRAIVSARTDRAVVGISIPLALQWQEAQQLTPICAAPAVVRTPSATGDLDTAARWLMEAQRPVILAGYGAVLSEAATSLEQLADKAQAALATTLLANGLFAGSPWSVGISGGFSTAGGAAILAQSDLVVAFGASFNEWTQDHGKLYPPGFRLIKVDVDATRLTPADRQTCALHGDARMVADALCSRVPQKRPSAWRAELPTVDRTPAQARVARESTNPDYLDPRALFARLESMLPVKRALIIDGGHNMGFAISALSVPDPRCFHFAPFFGSIGLGLGSAIGSATAHPDRITVCVVGDGGLSMVLGDLKTLIRQELPVLVVVVNDAAYGAELHQMQMLGLPTGESILGDVDFAATASALGGAGISVHRESDLDKLAPWLEHPTGPCVIDAKVDREVRALWLANVVDVR